MYHGIDLVIHRNQISLDADLKVIIGSHGAAHQLEKSSLRKSVVKKEWQPIIAYSVFGLQAGTSEWATVGCG